MSNKITYFTVIIFLYSQLSIAGNRGILFRIGEKFLNWSGFSFVEAEKKNEELDKKFTELDKKYKDHTGKQSTCTLDLMKTKESLQSKERDLKDCSNYSKFNSPEDDRNIGFPVSEILKAGCTGRLKLTKYSMVADSPDLKKSPEIVSDIEILKDQRWRSLVVREIRKVIEETRHGRSPEEFRVFPIDSSMDYGSIRYPAVVLGRTYEIDTTQSGGTLAKGIYKVKYNVSEDSQKRLEIRFEGDVSEVYSHMPVGGKYNYSLVCTGKTLVELNALAAKAKADAISQQKKILGE